MVRSQEKEGTASRVDAHMQNEVETIDEALLPPTTQIGLVALTVASLAGACTFYEQVLGFRLLEQGQRRAVLGAADEQGRLQPLLLLVAQPEAQPQPPYTTGLYHFAILVPSRSALERSLAHLVARRYPPGGYSDHLVSEALYLSDPEANGIEIYRDRPRETWRWQRGQVMMAVDPFDIQAMLAQGQRSLAEAAWDGLAAGTVIGHIHLRVADLREAERFYHQILGFEVTAQMPGALFVSAGGYHHHIGLNTWESRGAPPPPENSLGLRFFSVELPTAEEIERLAERLARADWPLQKWGDGLAVRDPWRNLVVLVPEEARSSLLAEDWGLASGTAM
jgi:catechol 2,3-dioxygenase